TDARRRGRQAALLTTRLHVAAELVHILSKLRRRPIEHLLAALFLLFGRRWRTIAPTTRAAWAERHPWTAGGAGRLVGGPLLLLHPLPDLLRAVDLLVEIPPLLRRRHFDVAGQLVRLPPHAVHRQFLPLGRRQVPRGFPQRVELRLSFLRRQRL